MILEPLLWRQLTQGTVWMSKTGNNQCYLVEKEKRTIKKGMGYAHPF